MKLKAIISFCLIISLAGFFTGCATPGQKTAIGGGGGAILGAGLGAIISKDSGKGAMIGAAIGGLLGGGVGNYLDKQAAELAAIAETKRTAEGLVTRLGSELLFETGKDELTADAKAKLEQIAAVIVKYPEDRLNVIGHTDSVGSDASNATLSVKRALAVSQYLAAKGIPSNTIRHNGMGETAPLKSNETELGRQANRRVEIEITVPDMQPAS